MKCGCRRVTALGRFLLKEINIPTRLCILIFGSQWCRIKMGVSPVFNVAILWFCKCILRSCFFFGAACLLDIKLPFNLPCFCCYWAMLLYSNPHFPPSHPRVFHLSLMDGYVLWFSSLQEGRAMATRTFSSTVPPPPFVRSLLTPIFCNAFWRLACTTVELAKAVGVWWLLFL